MWLLFQVVTRQLVLVKRGGRKVFKPTPKLDETMQRRLD